MSFKELDADELLAVAEYFALVPDDLPEGATTRKTLLIAALTEGDDPVTWEQYTDIYLPNKPVSKEERIAAAVEKEAVAATKRTVFVKMERRNPVFEVGKVRFTKDHPYALMTEEEAERVCTSYDGFRRATPKEAEEYYS